MAEVNRMMWEIPEIVPMTLTYDQGLPTLKERHVTITTMYHRFLVQIGQD